MAPGILWDYGDILEYGKIYRERPEHDGIHLYGVRPVLVGTGGQPLVQDAGVVEGGDRYHPGETQNNTQSSKQ